MHAKRRFVKLTTVQLPFLCFFAVERRVKNKFCLLLTEKDISLKFLLHKENVPRVVYTHPSESRKAVNNLDLASRLLFDFDLCPSGLDLFLDLVRLLLCHAFLDCLRGAFHKRLCFSQA
jgi:hypothetical protein